MELKFEIVRTKNGHERTKILYNGQLYGFKDLSKTPICIDRRLSMQTLKARWDSGNTTDDKLFEHKNSRRMKGKLSKLLPQEGGGLFEGLDQKTIDVLKYGTNNDLLAL